MNDMTYIMSGASMALKPGMGDKQDGDIYTTIVTKKTPNAQDKPLNVKILDDRD